MIFISEKQYKMCYENHLKYIYKIDVNMSLVTSESLLCVYIMD